MMTVEFWSTGPVKSMSEVETIGTLVVDDKGLVLPEKYAETTEGFVARTPTTTIDAKPGTSRGQHYGMVRIDDWHVNLDGSTVDVRNPDAVDDRVGLKLCGEEQEWYDVEFKPQLGVDA